MIFVVHKLSELEQATLQGMTWKKIQNSEDHFVERTASESEEI